MPLAAAGTVVSMDRLTQERIAENDDTFRRANERIREAAELYGSPEQVPFICECADGSCREIVTMSLREYEDVRRRPTHFLNAPGHVVAARGAARVVAEREGYTIVEKQGHAGEVAAELAEEAQVEG